MTIDEVKEIRRKIQKAQEARTKAEGAIEQLKAQLKKDYGIDSVEEAEAEIAQKKKALAINETRLEELLEKLENLTDWEEFG